MIDSISTKAAIDATTNILKNSDSTSDSMSEINAMRNDHDPRLKEASDLSIETKLINSQTNLNKAKVSKVFWDVLASPLSAFGYAGRKINEILNNYSEEQQRDLRNKINRVVDSDIEITPTNLPILASATEALLYAEQEPNLKEMFEDLIVNTIDKTKTTHPSFVEVLKQISSEDACFLNEFLQKWNRYEKDKNARIIYYRSRNNVCIDYPVLVLGKNSEYYECDEEFLPIYVNEIVIDNLERLKLVKLTKPIQTRYDGQDSYDVFQTENDYELLEFTKFGKSFFKGIIS